MKITKTASGKERITMTKSDWINFGRQAGWIKKTAQELPIHPIEDLGSEDDFMETEQPVEEMTDNLLSEIATEAKAWFEVVIASEDLNVEPGSVDTQELTERLYNVVQDAQAKGLEDRGELRRNLFQAASEWFTEKDRQGIIPVFDEIPAFHFKSIAQRVLSLVMDRDNLV